MFKRTLVGWALVSTMATLGGFGCGTGDASDIFSGVSDGTGASATGGGETSGTTSGGATQVGGGGTGAGSSQGAGSNQGGGDTGGRGGDGMGPGQGGGGAGGQVQVVEDYGCADTTRELFTDPVDEPNIAGCAGGFDVPGTLSAASLTQACGGDAGNDSGNPSGVGCSVADLCAFGWHVCDSAEDVAVSAANGECDDQPTFGDNAFFLTRQAQDGDSTCAPPPAVNNVVGCGNMGGDTLFDECGPLNRRMRWFDCSGSSVWSCGSNSNSNVEAEIIIKTGPEAGGVLCCRD